MKTILMFIISAFIISSCASTKTSTVDITPVGDWDYSITGTPEGDFTGVLSIVTMNKTYVGKMITSGTEVTINNFVWNKANHNIGGDFNYSGYPVYLDVTQTGEELTGSVSVEGMSFPFKATRKK
jgi:hypothetical protein